MIKKAFIFIEVVLVLLNITGCTKNKPYRIIESIDIPKSPGEWTYQHDNARFEFHFGNGGEGEEGLLVAFDNRDLIYRSETSGEFVSLLSFEYKDDTYIIITEYSQGEGCCFTEVFFVINDGSLEYLEEVFTGKYRIDEDGFKIRNGDLYLSYEDGGFAGFSNIPFTFSHRMTFTQYLTLNGREIKPSNELFKEEYLKRMRFLQTDVDKLYVDVSDRSVEEVNEKYEGLFHMEWLSFVLGISANCYMGEGEKNALRMFDEYFEKFREYSPRTYEEKDKIKNEFLKIMRGS